MVDFVYMTAVEVESKRHEHFTHYWCRGRDVAVSYLNAHGLPVTLTLADRHIGLLENEVLEGIPESQKVWEVDPDELYAILLMFFNVEAKHPVFGDLFFGLREMFKHTVIYGRLICPEFLDEIPHANKLLFEPDEFGTCAERIIEIMVSLTKQMGKFDCTIRRYVVTGEEPITTDSLDDAMLSKLRTNGKLLDLKPDDRSASPE